MVIHWYIFMALFREAAQSNQLILDCRYIKSTVGGRFHPIFWVLELTTLAISSTIDSMAWKWLFQWLELAYTSGELIQAEPDAVCSMWAMIQTNCSPQLLFFDTKNQIEVAFISTNHVVRLKMSQQASWIQHHLVQQLDVHIWLCCFYE